MIKRKFRGRSRSVRRNRASAPFLEMIEARQLQSGFAHPAGLSAAGESVQVGPATQGLEEMPPALEKLAHRHHAVPIVSIFGSARPGHHGSDVLSTKSDGSLAGSRAGTQTAHPDFGQSRGGGGGGGGSNFPLAVTSYLRYPVETLYGNKMGNGLYSSFELVGQNPSDYRDFGIFAYTSRPLGNEQTEYYYYVTCANDFGNKTIEATSLTPYYFYEPQFVMLYAENPYYAP
jgi:hypothetical protein